MMSKRGNLPKALARFDIICRSPSKSPVSCQVDFWVGVRTYVVPSTSEIICRTVPASCACRAPDLAHGDGPARESNRRRVTLLASLEAERYSVLNGSA